MASTEPKDERRVKRLRRELRYIEDAIAASADRLRQIAHEGLAFDEKKSDLRPHRSRSHG